MSQEPGKISLAGEISATLNNAVQSGGPRRPGVAGVLPRRGGRKKTLSLNPEEREALENLIEEVIIDGGMGDSESASSDDEENTKDGSGKNKSDAVSNANAISETNDSKALTAFKISKKFYPGQLKVALKHMTDLPPRFSRKLKKAEKYLEMNALQKNTSVSAIIKEEDEEEVLSFNMASNPSNAIEDNQVPSVSPKQIINDKVKTQKEKMQKDLKKTIRSLLTDLDQYVDEKDRTSISLDLPGAVSCADLERETLGYPIKPPDSVPQPPTSPNVEASVSMTEIVVVSSSLNSSSGSEKQKSSSTTKSITQGQFNQPSIQKSFITTAPSSSNYCHPPDLSVPKMSGIEKTKPTLTEKSAFQQYSNLTPTNFMESSSVIVPVGQLLPQMPQIDFSVPPPSTYQFPAQYGMPSSQESFVQNNMQFQPQFGFIELPATASTHPASNYVGTTPIIFQQYNTLPIVSRHQQVPSIPYAGSPGYFVGRFNAPSRPVQNYVQQFQNSPLAASEPPSMLGERLAQNVVPKHRMNNFNVGNFRAPYKNKATSNQPINLTSNQPINLTSNQPTNLTKFDPNSYKNKYRNAQNYIKQDATKQMHSFRDNSAFGNYMPESQAKPNPSCGIPQVAINVAEETMKVPEVIFKLDQDRPSPISRSPTEPSPVQSSSTIPSFVDKSDAKSPNDDLKYVAKCDTVAGRTADDDSSERSVDDEPRKSSSENIALVQECPVTDIDLGTTESEIDAGKTGLNVVLGASFVRKLSEMFVNSDSAKDCCNSRPVFLSSSVLKEIFASLTPVPIENSLPASNDNLEY